MSRQDHRFGYTILELYCTGLRMVGDFDEEAAIEAYLKMHPETKEENVRAELMSELERLDRAEREHGAGE